MKKLLCICLLAALCVACLAAQDVFATIGGTILDPTGAAVPMPRSRSPIRIATR